MHFFGGWGGCSGYVRLFWIEPLLIMAANDINMINFVVTTIVNISTKTVANMSLRFKMPLLIVYNTKAARA